MSWTAHFQPQAWINDEAVDVDPEDEQTWDCTEWAEQHQDYIDRLIDHAGPSVRTEVYELVDNDDVFQRDPAAPLWVQTWSGPFTITLTPGRHPGREA